MTPYWLLKTKQNHARLTCYARGAVHLASLLALLYHGGLVVLPQAQATALREGTPTALLVLVWGTILASVGQEVFSRRAQRSRQVSGR